MTTDVATPLSPTDQVAIAGLTQRVVAAWATHDADAFGSVFTDDGTMILPGLYLRGSQQIAEYMRKAFDGQYRGTQVTGTPIELKPLGPDACALVTQGGVLLPGESEVNAERAIRASWITVRQGAEWKLALYQNSPRHD